MSLDISKITNMGIFGGGFLDSASTRRSPRESIYS